MASRKIKSGSTNSPDKKLPLNKSIPLGIQHVLAMFAGNITVPIIVAGVFGQTPEQKTNGFVCCVSCNNYPNSWL